MDKFSFVEKLFLVSTPFVILYMIFLPYSDHLLQYLISLVPAFE